MIKKVTIMMIILLSVGQLFAQEKITIAVLDFDAFGISEFEVKSLTNRLRGLLVRQKEYRVVERGLMTQILDEQGLQQSGCTSNECVVEIGQMLGVKVMLAGSFGVVGDLITIDMRIIDVESGGIMKSSLTDIEGGISVVLTKGLNIALNQLLHDNDMGPVERAKKTLQLRSEPMGAEVSLNGKNLGKTPLELPDLYVGESVDLLLELLHYEQKNVSFEITERMSPNVTIPMERGSGNLSLTGSPQKGKLYVDKTFFSKLPVQSMPLSAGEHLIKIKVPKYKTYYDRIIVNQGRENILNYQMDKKLKAPAVFLSLVVPGSGQIYLGKTMRGLFWMAATAYTGALVFDAHNDYLSHSDDYDANLVIYNSNTSQPELWEEQKYRVQQSFDGMQDANQQRMIFGAVMGSVWSINVIGVTF